MCLATIDNTVTPRIAVQAPGVWLFFSVGHSGQPNRRGAIFGIGLARVGIDSLIFALRILGSDGGHVPESEKAIQRVDHSSSSPISFRFEQPDSGFPGARSQISSVAKCVCMHGSVGAEE
jgi:hypothetical protein